MASDQGNQHQRDHQRQQQAGIGGGGALDGLLEQRQVQTGVRTPVMAIAYGAPGRCLRDASRHLPAACFHADVFPDRSPQAQSPATLPRTAGNAKSYQPLKHSVDDAPAETG